MSLYSLSKIEKNFGERNVLNIHSLNLEKGKIYSLLGANGAGKTTLLNILAFLDHPSSGRMLFNSQKVKFSENYLYKLRKKVVMIAQYPIMFSTTVYKNIEFGLKIRKIPQKKRMCIINESLEMVDMLHLKEAHAQHLSGGETQRVAFARAMALSPEVILCDEPTSSVDFENQSSIFHILSKINEQKGITLVFTSHDKLQAATLAHHQIFLEHGKLANASYENLFTGMVTTKTDGMSLCIIQNEIQLHVPFTEAGKIRLLIDPEKIIPLEEGTKNDQTNVLQGKITQIAEENDKIRIVINAGLNFTLLMTKQDYSYRRQLYVVGNQLQIQIPTGAIQKL